MREPNGPLLDFGTWAVAAAVIASSFVGIGPVNGEDPDAVPGKLARDRMAMPRNGKVNGRLNGHHHRLNGLLEPTTTN